MTAFWIIILVGIFALIQVGYYHRSALKKVSYHRSFSHKRVFAGDKVELVEVLANGKGRYVVLECCGDRRQLQSIRRRIQGQMKGLNESSGKVQARLRVLDRLKARLSPRKQKRAA